MNYNQKIIAFALNLKQSKNVNVFKTEMIEFLKKFESDDRIYIYNNSGDSFAKSSGVVAELSRYDFEGDLPFYDLLRDAIFALDFESQLDKVLFVFNDSYYDVYQVSKMMRMAENMDCEVHFFEVGRKPKIENSTVLPNLEGLSSILCGLYKKEGL